MDALLTPMCIRCGETQAPEPLGLCAACVMHTRVEIVDGLKRLSRYLAAWAAFDDYLRQEGAA
jgi:hypothetical protein